MSVRKFNFGNVDKVLSNSTQSKPAEQNVLVKEETKQEGVDQKTPVTELLNKIDRPGSEYKKAFNFKMVPRKKIVFHKDNDFPMEEIEKRAEDILELGLIHNLEALYDEDQDIYIIESGEKRTRAIDLLIERYSTYAGDLDAPDYKNYLKHIKQFEVEGYPVNVKYFDPTEFELEEGSDEAEELRQIDSKIRVNRANLDVLMLQPAFIRQKIEENTELYTRRNSLVNKEKRVNINKTIAEELNISDRQVQKYKAISKLIPELQKLFDERGITVNEGAKYAMLDESEQKQILELIESGADKKEIGALQDKLSSMQKEIDARKREVRELENEKHKALEAVENEKRAAARLEEQIREKIYRENQKLETADKQQIEELKERLETANRNIKKYQSRTEELERAKDKKIADLELKLESKEKQALIAPAKITRTALQMESILSSVRSLVKDFEVVLGEYQDVYDAATGELSPEEYKRKLKECLYGTA